MTSPADPSPCGLLVVDKARGPTSMQACAAIRARLRRGGAPKRVKVGHAGTLDPLATGVLVIMVGRATKLCDRVMAGDKEYEAIIDLSRTSPTDDEEGSPVGVETARIPTMSEVASAVRTFIGDIRQVPPVHSAVLVKGKRSYSLARKGRPPTLHPRHVTIRAIEIRSYEWPLVHLAVHCEKGTYVRSLARDLGAALRCGGMLVGLRRTRVGRWTIGGARTLEEIPTVLIQADLDSVPPDLQDR